MPKGDGEKINLLDIPYEQGLFLLKLIFGRIYGILEATSVGFVIATDEHLNAEYIHLSDYLNGILQRKDFLKLKDNLPPDLPEHLFEGISDRDVWWECGGQDRMLGFVGDIDTAWIRAGQKIFPSPEWLVKYLNAVDVAVAQHREYKAEQWSKIEKNLEERKQHGEFSFETPTQDEKQAKKRESDGYILYLERGGDLWREPKKTHCYPMMQAKKRLDIVRLLAGNMTDKYIDTNNLAKGLGKNAQYIRSEISKINRITKVHLSLKLIESKQGSGYRLYPNIKIKILPR